jgi:hypothetical protein
LEVSYLEFLQSSNREHKNSERRKRIDLWHTCTGIPPNDPIDLQNNLISLLPGAQDAGRLTWRSSTGNPPP